MLLTLLKSFEKVFQKLSREFEGTKIIFPRTVPMFSYAENLPCIRYGLQLLAANRTRKFSNKFSDGPFVPVCSTNIIPIFFGVPLSHVTNGLHHFYAVENITIRRDAAGNPQKILIKTNACF